MARISDAMYDGKMRDQWFKFLGRYLTETLSEDRAKEVLLEDVQNGAKKIESTALRGSVDLGQLPDVKNCLGAACS